MDLYIKRNDTLPIIEYQCLNEANNPENVSDATIRFNMGWKFYLPGEINSTTTTSFTWPEYIPCLLIGDKVVIDQERMTILDIDRINGTVAVERGVDLTSVAKHAADAIAQVIRIEATGVFKTSGLDGWVTYEWNNATGNDTKLSGKYNAEFEITFLATGKKKTFPTARQTGIFVNIVDDINRR
jgi:hypothetical protein